MNSKIVLSVFIAFLVSISILYGFQSWSKSYVDIFRLQDDFYSQQFDNTKKIVILGSSEIANLNMTYINMGVSSFGYDVYNLGLPADNPVERYQSIDKIISLQPSLIIYGIGILDFVESSNIELFIDKPKNPLPEVQDLYSVLNTNSFDFESPKFLSLKVLDSIMFEILGISSEDNIIKDKTPFYLHGLDVYKISNSTNIISDYNSRQVSNKITESSKNPAVLALHQIIDKVDQAGIDLIIITTPKHYVYFDNLSKEQEMTYENILNSLSAKNISIYRFDDKYVDKNIWYDYRHVAIHPDGIVFSQDVLNLILEKIN